MKEAELTASDIERRFAEINTKEPEELTPEEALSLAEAEAVDDGTTISLEEYKKELE